MLGEDLLDEVAVALRDHRPQVLLELGRVELTHALVLAGDHDVDAVGLVADVLVDPRQLDLELLGGEAHGAEHAEAARLRDRGDDVAAMGEGEDRELDAELLGQFGLHGVPFQPSASGMCLKPLMKSERRRRGSPASDGLG